MFLSHNKYLLFSKNSQSSSISKCISRKSSLKPQVDPRAEYKGNPQYQEREDTSSFCKRYRSSAAFWTFHAYPDSHPAISEDFPQYIFTASTGHLICLLMLGVSIKQILPKGQAVFSSIGFELSCGFFPQGESASAISTPAFPKQLLCFMLGLYLAHTWHFSYLGYTWINRTTSCFYFRNEAEFS